MHGNYNMEVKNPNDPRFERIECSTKSTDKGSKIEADTECTFYKSDE